MVGYLQSLSQDLLFGSDLNEFSDVEGRDSEGLGVAELAVRLGVVGRPEDHVLALEGAQTFAALDADPVKHDVGNDDGLFRVNLLLAGRALLVSQGSLHLLPFESLLLFLSKEV